MFCLPYIQSYILFTIICLLMMECVCKNKNTYLLCFFEVRLKSVANYYIWNLAFADLLFVCSLPLFFWASAGRAWPVRGAVVGQLTCRVAYAARGTSRFAGVFTLIALSVDRCLATFPRQRHLRTIRAGKLVCGAIWLAAFLFSTPYLRYATTTPSAAARARGLTAVKCRLPWPGYRRGAAAWVYTMLTVDLLIPTCVILVAYGVIWRRVRRVMARARAPTTATSSHRPNRKMTRTVLVIVVSFVLCQMPYHVMQVVSLGKMPTGETPRDLPRVSHSELVRFVYLNMVAQVLIFVAACCNPIIYGLLNDNYGEYSSTFNFNVFYFKDAVSLRPVKVSIWID